MNPTKMRDTYGKLMFILMDTESEAVKSELNIDLVKNILTVSSYLSAKQGLDLLLDPLLETATAVLDQDSYSSKTREELDNISKNKSSAIKELCVKFKSELLTEDDIKRVLDSISDNNSYLSFNVKPVEKLIFHLKNNFDRLKEDPNFSLELTSKPKKRPNSSSFGGGGYFSSLSSYVYSGYTLFLFCVLHINYDYLQYYVLVLVLLILSISYSFIYFS